MSSMHLKLICPPRIQNRHRNSQTFHNLGYSECFGDIDTFSTITRMPGVFTMYIKKSTRSPVEIQVDNFSVTEYCLLNIC